MPPLSKFPAISDKLSQPKKLSTFERERQEAESKRLREAVATEKALRDFEDEFANDDSDDYHQASSRSHRVTDDRFHTRQHGNRDAGLSGDGLRPGRPTFQRERDDGQDGSRDAQRGYGRARAVAEFGTSGPPPTLKRKRLEAEGRLDSTTTSGSRSDSRPSRTGAELVVPDDSLRVERDVRRPTALLHHLPPGTTETDVRELMNMIVVEKVMFISSETRRDRTQSHTQAQPQPHAQTQTQTRTQAPSQAHSPFRGGRVSALVIAGAHTPVSEVDNAVSSLQGKYLGFGAHLKISRHISLSGTQDPQTADLAYVNDAQPFGARTRLLHNQSNINLRNAPPPRDMDRDRPAAWDRARTAGGGSLTVAVRTPNDIRLLRLIHGTAEKLLTLGPAFEAMLMADRKVQRDEKWAWLFDPTSEGGVYYRWLIWKLARGERPDAGAVENSECDIFDAGPAWIAPEHSPSFGAVQAFEDLVHDSAYESSDDEAPGGTVDDGDADRAKYLNPYRRAKLTHLLARLPESIAFLRAGDVARVTNFVVNNAGHGAEEIVDMILCNIEAPFGARVVYSHDEIDGSPKGGVQARPAKEEEHETQNITEQEQQVEKEKEKERDRSDPAAAKLVAFYIISDVVQTSSVSGVKDAWKYRTLFESSLAQRKIFAHLGGLEREYDWGRMKAEQWKRKIGFVLSLWEGRSIFPKAAMDGFKADFEAAGSGSVSGARVGSSEIKAVPDNKWKTAQSSGSREANATNATAIGTDETDKTDLVAQKIAAIKAKAAAAAAAENNNSTVTDNSQTSVDSRNLGHKTEGGGAGDLSTEDSTQQTGSFISKRYRPTAAELNDARLVQASPAAVGFQAPVAGPTRSTVTTSLNPSERSHGPNVPADERADALVRGEREDQDEGGRRRAAQDGARQASLGFSLALGPSAVEQADRDDRSGADRGRTNAAMALGFSIAGNASAKTHSDATGGERRARDPSRERSALDDMFDSD